MNLRDLDEAGKDVRAWCFACARGERVDSLIWQHFAERHLPMGLDAAARHFRCRECGSSDEVRLYPAKRPWQPALTAADMAAAIFFGARKAAKARRRDPIAERAALVLQASIQKQKSAPSKVSRQRPKLLLVWSKLD